MTETLPLHYQTPERWAGQALVDVLSLLNDHAYLERKAATNALQLLNRWPAPRYPDAWVSTLSAIARDEALHLHQVTRLIAERGGRLERLHHSPYANALRRLVRDGDGPREVVDRLLVSALIEARSCERFDLLARHCLDAPLRDFYRSLWTSEFGHHRVFLALAKEVRPEDDVEKRWQMFLEEEAGIIQQQLPGPRLHSGVARTS